MALDLQGIDLALLPVLHDLLHTRSTTLTAATPLHAVECEPLARPLTEAVR